MPAALLWAIQAIQIATQLAAAGKDIVSTLNYIRDTLKTMQAENRDPSPEEWSALNQKTLDLLAELNSPK